MKRNLRNFAVAGAYYNASAFCVKYKISGNPGIVLATCR